MQKKNQQSNLLGEQMSREKRKRKKVRRNSMAETLLHGSTMIKGLQKSMKQVCMKLGWDVCECVCVLMLVN